MAQKDKGFAEKTFKKLWELIDSATGKVRLNFAVDAFFFILFLFFAYWWIRITKELNFSHRDAWIYATLVVCFLLLPLQATRDCRSFINRVLKSKHGQ